MKKIAILTIGMLTIASAYLAAENYTYQDSWAESGFNLANSTPFQATVIYSINDFSLNNALINNSEMQTIMLPGHFLPNQAGAPDLPGSARYLAVPENASVSYKIISARTETFSDVLMAPAPRIPLETEDGPLDYIADPAIYNNNAYYPESPVMLSEPMQIRGINTVLIGITPFQYNPVSRELIVYRDLEIEVSFHGGNGRFGEDRLRSRWFDPLLKNMLLNFDMLPEIDFQQQQTSSRTPDYEYLIISPDDANFLAWADSIKTWRQQQGIRTGVVTISEVGGNNQTQIENYINDAYYNWDIPPVAVLLLADYGSSGNTITSPTWNGGYAPCVSDNIYADVTGNDLPDIIFARMTAQNQSHLQTMIGKFLSYERQPPEGPECYSNPLFAGGWQTERWFILCTEVVQGYLENIQGKTPEREYAIYSGSPGSQWSTATNTGTVVNYFGPNGLGYIPATPADLTDWGGNATGINNAINAGTFMVLHRDHGEESGWGEPYYVSSHLNSLNNEILPFVFSINCLTGKYNLGGECFAEAFHRHNQGALGIIAASEVSYSFVNDAYVWGMFDYIWSDFDPGYGSNDANNFLPAFASAYGKYYLQASGWPYNSDDKDTVHHLFHHHGDAFSIVYSEPPQPLIVLHDPVLLSGVNFFDVSADEGAFIALTIDGEILGTAEGTGYPVSINIEPQLPGQTLSVTVTKQNHYRYTEHLQIIPPDGAYVVHNDYQINDENGNNNGLIDYNESILLSLSLENVGLELAENVQAVISTSDQYITLTDSVEVFGNIDPSSIVTVENSFAFDVSNAVPDEHIAHFTVSATDGESTWESNFVIEIFAPLITVIDFYIDDSSGNNDGILDPGETATIIIPTYNTGHSLSPDAMSYVVCSDDQVYLDNDSYPLGEIPAESYAEALYTLTVSEELNVGSVFTLFYSAVAGEYTAGADFNITIGLSLENFESGDFTSYPWELNSQTNWVINSAAYEGNYCAKTGPISDGQSTDLQLELYTLTDSEISFWVKVSSEANYDFLRFYIDNSEQAAWSGESGWTEVIFPVSEGVHTFLWSYEKDGSVSNGSDCGWIDYIIFPPNALGATGFISGMVSANAEVDYEQVLISAGDYTTNPDETGFYQMELPYGMYDVSAVLMGFETVTYQNVNVPPFETVVIDFQLPYIAPPVDLTAELADDTVTLTWIEPERTEAEKDITRNPGKNDLSRDGGRSLLYYKIYRNLDNSNFSFLYATTQEQYTDVLPDIGAYGYYVTGIYSGNSESEPSDTVYVEYTSLSENQMPLVTKLTGNYPNPFNPDTNIMFSLKDNSRVRLDIFNTKGEKVISLVNAELEAGQHSIYWNGQDHFGKEVSTGVYFYKFEATDFTSVKKMILMK